MPFTLPDNDVAFNANQSIWFETDISILVAALNGEVVLSGCAPTSNSNMTVAIAAGVIQIADGSSVTVTGGNVTHGTADVSNPRIDLITASTTGVKTVTAGTAAANPKAPALPAGHVAVAMVYVPANDTVLAANQITDKRIFNEAVPAVSASTPAAAPHDGMLWWDTDDSGGAPGGGAFSEFTQDLGAARSSGTFDITGLSGLAANKPVLVMQTPAAIASKGDARDEPEMDHINITGYVVDATTIRCYWQAPSVVVGTYAFGYFVGA